jgi:acyl-CoA synthetase (NDP forming)
LSELHSRRAVYGREALRRLIDPQSIAIVGLSRNEASFGARTARNLRLFGGRAYGVNPGADELHGLRCAPTVAELPEPVDCAILAVPLERVEAVVEDCAAAGVGACVIYASGFAETGRADRIALQNRLAAIGAGAGMRIVGPNSMGLINNVTRAGMSFSSSYGDRQPALGPVGIVSQSGGLGQAITQAADRGGAFSHYLSCGNSCDVDVCDYVSYLADDPGCRAIACAAEGFRDGERFIEAAERALAADKPLVLCKIATGTRAASAAMSHTGTLAGSNAALEAVCRRLAVITVDNLEDVYETASFLAKAGHPTAAGVAAVAASGGAIVIDLDKAEKFGVPMPQPSPATQGVLDANVPDFGNAGNPCDVTAQVATNPASYSACAGALLADPSYAALVVTATSIMPTGTPQSIAMFAGLAAEAGKPVCYCWVSGWREGPGAAECEASPHVALFNSTEGTFRTLAAWLERERRLAAPPPRARRGRPNPASVEARRLLGATADRLTEREAKSVLAAYGVPVTLDRPVQDASAAVAAAEAIGYPVVLKVESPDIAHKTEAGVVRLNLDDGEAVRQAFAEVMAAARRLKPRPRIAGVLVQPMIAGGVEVVVGARLDPTFGPLVLVGLGGIMVELLADTTVELAPVDRRQALDMLARLKGAKLLTGFRGAAGVDLDRLAGIVVAVSELAADLSGEIAEIDVNPIICGPGRAIAVDALVVRSDTD